MSTSKVTWANKYRHLALAIVLCWYMTPCLGQASLPTTYHRWYVGTQLTSHYYAVIFPSGLPSMSSPNPLQLVAGYQFTPRLAMQISGLYRHRNLEWGGAGTTVTGQPTATKFKHQNWNTAVPVSLRHTLTRQSARRVQVDGALGLSFISIRYTTRQTIEIDGQVTEEYNTAQKATGTYLTGGISGRLGFGKTRRVEAVLDLLVNRNIEQFSTSIYQYLDAPGGLTRAYGLGLRYRFL